MKKRVLYSVANYAEIVRDNGNIGGYVSIPGAIDPVLFEQAVNLLPRLIFLILLHRQKSY